MKNEIKILRAYLIENRIAAIISVYIIISVIIKSYWHYDICIPCLYKTIFGIECLGCGITSACVELTHQNFVGAYEENPLVFIIVPTLVIYIISDYKKFRRQQILTTN